MKVKLQKLLDDCIERGVDYGYNRAYKHTDSPTEEVMKQCIYDSIIIEIHEYFDFDEINEI